MSETKQRPLEQDDDPAQVDEFLRIARQLRAKRPSEPTPTRD